MLERRVESARRNRRATGSDVASVRDVGAVASAFAQAGGFVLLGPQLAWLTRPCAHGRHVRLVAPWARRVEAEAERRELTPREAADHLRRADRAAARWCRRFWPDTEPDEAYAVDCNVSALMPGEVARVAAALRVSI